MIEDFACVLIQHGETSQLICSWIICLDSIWFMVLKRILEQPVAFLLQS